MSIRHHALPLPARMLLFRLVFVVVPMVLLPLIVVGAAKADPLALMVSNNSTMPLESVQISPDYSPRWGGNRLDGAVDPGQGQVIRVPDPGPDCFFDVQIGDAAGDVFQYWGINLCTRPNLDHR